MSYTATYKKLDGGEAEFTGEIAAEVFDGYRKHALEHVGGNLEIPGFRKGKAPESIIEKNVPEMAILEEMANHAIMDIYPKLLGEHKVEAIGSPMVQITKIARGNPLGFVIKTAVMPEVTLPDYKKIAKAENKNESTDVTDEEFENAKSAFEAYQIKAFEAAQKAKETKAKKLAEKLAKMSEEERIEREEYERLKKKYK